jgi:hypothetical protein
VPRELNEVAHTLAKKAAFCKIDECWLEDVPSVFLVWLLGKSLSLDPLL